MGYCEICGVNGEEMEKEIEALNTAWKCCDVTRERAREERDKWKSLTERMGNYIAKQGDMVLAEARHRAKELLKELEEMKK